MATLSQAQRDAIPQGKFAGPGRTYPVDTPNRAANAKARATQAVNDGRMSEFQALKIKSRADKVLGK